MLLEHKPTVANITLWNSLRKQKNQSNIDDYKEKLKTVILTQKQNDASFVQSIVGKELQAANIKVKDQAFQNIFTQYIVVAIQAQVVPQKNKIECLFVKL